MTKYNKATLHANGETKEFSNAEDAKRLRAAFHANYFLNHDGTKEFGVTADASTFVELDVDTTATPLAPKPQCDNYGQCSEAVSESVSESVSQSVSESVSESQSQSDSNSESQA